MEFYAVFLIVSAIASILWWQLRFRHAIGDQFALAKALVLGVVSSVAVDILAIALLVMAYGHNLMD